MSDQRLCIFGEVLFDHFPDGARVLGGAPFNVAWHLQAFGQTPRFISRVGHDPEGDAVRTAMRDWGMDTGGLQADPGRPTGRVSVSFSDGEPEYDIVEQCAYDAIELKAADVSCRLLYHGSLALREPASRHTAQQLRESGPEIVFVDVNLRSPWWQRTQVLEMLNGADWVKLNNAELELLHPTTEPGPAQAAAFLAMHGLQGLVLTHGSAGAEVITADGGRFTVSPAAELEVVDTVGAGDAFSSVMILGLTNDWPLDLTLQRAQDFASRLVGRRGATVADRAFYTTFINDWNPAA